MSNYERIVKKGDKFIVTCGAYSDDAINSAHIALKDFDVDVQKALFIEEYDKNTPEEKRKRYSPTESQFIDYLNVNGFIEDSHVNELYLGNFSFRDIRIEYYKWGEDT